MSMIFMVWFPREQRSDALSQKKPQIEHGRNADYEQLLREQTEKAGAKRAALKKSSAESTYLYSGFVPLMVSNAAQPRQGRHSLARGASPWKNAQRRKSPGGATDRNVWR
jgi:hypothetical protein